MNKVCKLMMTGACLAFAAVLEAVPLKLAENGKALYSIVHSQEAVDAAKELKTALDEIAGADFSLGAENNGLPAIYVGRTALAEKDKDFADLGYEEWLVKTQGNDVVICGGDSYGTLYGVYELLERRFGCRWLAYDTTVMPKNANLELDDGIILHGKPSFMRRDIVDEFYRTYWGDKEYYKSYFAYKKHARASLNYGHWEVYCPRKVTSRLYHEMHNFYDFLDPRKYFAEHPEYFSMGKDGKRFHGTLGETMQGGNFCMSNPDVRKIFLDKLREYIKTDREKLPKEKWPTVYNISQMDNCEFFCLCPECKAISEKYGSDSGLLLEFLNPLAEEIYKEYPELTIMTFAYAGGKKAPNGIKPFKNIVLQWCNLYGFNDCYRPITHEVNARQREQFDKWAQSGARMAIWVYWNMGGQYFDPPRVETLVNAIAPEFRYYHDNGVPDVFVEAEYDQDHPQPFYHLHDYMGHRLLYDVDADPEILIDDFIAGYYGPAAKNMGAYLNMLRDAVRNVDFQMTSVATGRPYCNSQFMEKVWNELMAAYNATEEGSLYRKHIEHDMVTPAFVTLKNTNWTFGDRDFMLAVYKKFRQARIDSVKKDADRIKLTDKFENDLKSFVTVNLPVPKGFEDKETIMIGWPKLSWAHNSNSQTIVDDPDSITGKALITPVSTKPEMHDISKEPIKGFLPLNFGAYDYTNKKSIGWYFRGDVPQDEKYHWYRIGRYDIGPGAFVWGFYWGTRCDISWCHRGDDGMPGLNDWEIWVSAKFTGPAYVKDSTSKNEIYWDQVMLVK